VQNLRGVVGSAFIRRVMASHTHRHTLLDSVYEVRHSRKSQLLVKTCIIIDEDKYLSDDCDPLGTQEYE
jgi:hypothetical protein